MVHAYEGRPYSAHELKFLKPSFRESYEALVTTRSHDPFVTCFTGARAETKSFGAFHSDVEDAVKHLNHANAASTIATVSGNSYRHLVYQTATLLSGRTLCPLNPNEGEPRMRAKIEALATDVSIWNENGFLLVNSSSKRDKSVARPFALIFTSGSSGESKIVEWEEHNLLCNADALIEHHRMFEGLRIGTPLPIYHVNALGFSFLSSLLSGSRLVLFDRFSFAAIQTALRNRQVDVLSLTPTHLHLLLARADAFTPQDWAGVKYVVSAAAPLSSELVRNFLARFGVRIVQGYGLSEAVNFSATLPIDLTEDVYRKLMIEAEHPSIGVALRGNEIEIVDDAERPCPPETPGDIVLRGFNVMRGYRGVDPTETFAKRGLRTGDVGYYKDLNGRRFFFVSGRKKDLIKRYGETLSLREVDEMFRLFNPEADAIAVGFPNSLAGEELGLIVNDSLPALESRLEDFMSKRVPAMFRPKVVLVTAKELRTPSGKPQRWRFLDQFAEFRSENFGSKTKVKRNKESE